MHFTGYKHHIRSQQLRPFVLPFAIVLGILFHGFFGKLAPYSPFIIFLILFLTLCDMDFKQIRITGLHLWIMGFQFVVGIIFYFALVRYNSILAQGALMGMFAPVAVSATVVAVVLGANMATMVTYTILYNVVISIVAPITFSLIRFSEVLPFWVSCWAILKKVAPLIVLPIVLALISQKVFPKINKHIVKHKMVPFYLWACALTIVIGQTLDYIIVRKEEGSIIFMMAFISLVECFLEFGFGRWIGRKYGDVIAGGQALGQKNGVISVWMCQTFLDPLSSVVPATYVIWQNCWNSWQMWRLNKKKDKTPVSEDDTQKNS